MKCPREEIETVFCTCKIRLQKSPLTKPCWPTIQHSKICIFPEGRETDIQMLPSAKGFPLLIIAISSVTLFDVKDEKGTERGSNCPLPLSVHHLSIAGEWSCC